MKTAVKVELPIIILGAGSAGLTAATQLVKSGRKVIVIEKEDRLGGLAHTVCQNSYSFDFGPHAFHSKSDEADEVFKEFSAGKYRKIYMKACLLLQKKYFDYPLKFGQAVFRLNPFFTIRMLADYFKTKIRDKIIRMPEDSFEAWGIRRYGRTMYDMAFGNYSSKVWGMPAKLLHKKLAQQKLPDMKFLELVKETFGAKGAKQKILYSAYFYPQGGIGTIFESMSKFCLNAGAQIFKNSYASRICLKENRVVGVEVTSGDKKFEIGCSGLIFTIPIPEVTNFIFPQPSPEIVDSAASLIYRNLILVFMEVEASNVTGQLMVYLLDKDFVFNRIGEQKNVDPGMIPGDKTILSMEICCADNDRLWNAPDEYLFSLARKDLLKLNKVPDRAISNFCIKRIRQVYPIYDLEFDKNLNKAIEYMYKLENIFPVGRQGLYINNDIHDSMQMGLEISRHILEGKEKRYWNEKVKSYLNWRLK